MGLLIKGNKAVLIVTTAVVFDTLSQCVTEKEKVKFTSHPPEHQWLPCFGGPEPHSKAHVHGSGGRDAQGWWWHLVINGLLVAAGDCGKMPFRGFMHVETV